VGITTIDRRLQGLGQLAGLRLVIQPLLIHHTGAAA